MPSDVSSFQNRVAQETIMFKEEQVREAQAWITRVREMDVFQSTTNQSLQAELRERTEQYNQLWMGFQRQVDLYLFSATRIKFHFLLPLLLYVLLYSCFGLHRFEIDTHHVFHSCD
jgi:hypothetical protein